jgi:hypothetical protein
MIINTISNGDRFAYYCNGTNDDIELVTFIEQLRNNGFSNFTVEIIGNFKKSSTAPITIDNTGYTQITLDFAKCSRITSPGAFLGVTNVRVLNCAVYHQNNAADADIYTFRGTNTVFENCRITGAYRSGACRGFSATNTKVINCSAEITNNDGTIYGIYGHNATVIGCSVDVTSANASAYGIEGVAGSFAADSRFKGTSNSTGTTASGNGGIGGGYYSNCEFIGLGAVKGQGFYIRAGAWVTMNNCIFRGYTKNTSAGWGVGLMGQSDDAVTAILFGINCNQEALSGFTQTGAMQLPGGYGAYAGTFYTAPVVGANIKAIASYNRNRS